MMVDFIVQVACGVSVFILALGFLIILVSACDGWSKRYEGTKNKQGNSGES